MSDSVFCYFGVLFFAFFAFFAFVFDDFGGLLFRGFMRRGCA